MVRNTSAFAMLAACVLSLALTACSPAREQTEDVQSKSVTVMVIHGDGSVKTSQIETTEDYLGPALTASGLADGVHDTYGLFITTVDGEAADEEKEEWWCLTKRGADIMTGADKTPIADGDTFELTLMTGY